MITRHLWQHLQCCSSHGNLSVPSEGGSYYTLPVLVLCLARPPSIHRAPHEGHPFFDYRFFFCSQIRLIASYVPNALTNQFTELIPDVVPDANENVKERGGEFFSGIKLHSGEALTPILLLPLKFGLFTSAANFFISDQDHGRPGDSRSWNSRRARRHR